MDLSLITTKLKKEFPIIPKPIKAHPKKAAVLVMLYPKHNKTHVLMIKRALHLKSHAGEIGFPGGGYEEGKDKNYMGGIPRQREIDIIYNKNDNNETSLVKSTGGFFFF